MKGDFSRSTFDPHKHYSSVRMQQGRVQLDADWNEQADILLHLIHTQLEDLLGASATPAAQAGFTISEVGSRDEAGDQPGEADAKIPPPDFWIGAGRCYVEGNLCENERKVLFSRQPDYPAAASLFKDPAEEPSSHDQYLVYLDVWQRHITAVEDPDIRETSLGGSDTTTRLKNVWQVKLLPLSGEQGQRADGDLRSLDEWKDLLQQVGQKRRLSARTTQKSAALENCLYRFEIHSAHGERVVYKWSRENGSVVFPVAGIKHSQKLGTLTLTLADLQRAPYQLQEGAWVELASDLTVLNEDPLPLCKVVKLDRDSASVTLHPEKGQLDRILKGMGRLKQHHPLLRRWEYFGETSLPGASEADEGTQSWLDLEKGIQVAFDNQGALRSGDYWLIPARTRSEDGIEWPHKGGQPLPQPLHGVRHWFAPLALLQFQGERWSVCARELAVFQTLPEITNKLSSIVGQLQDAFARLNLVQENVDTLILQEHVFETVKSKDELERGAVVSLDHAAIARMDAADPDIELPVRLASSTDAKMVVGVVWEAIEEDEDGHRYRIVLHGRARCKVLGLIKPGDLLVPSDQLGYARKAGRLQRPGTVFGKALGFTKFEPAVMEEIEEGTRRVEANLGQQPGTVDVLVTLG
jgi:hypothetical protein